MMNITIVEDHTLFRKGIRSLLSSIADFEVDHEFSDGREFLDNLSMINSDVVLMDIEMPQVNGIEASREAKMKRPELNIIALSMYSDQKYYSEMIKAGISGFVLKEASPEELETAIRNVCAGLGFFSPKLLQQALVNIPGGDKKEKNIARLKLTEREVEILELICQGLNNSEISEKLFLSRRTIESHKANLLKKSGTKNSAGLIIYSIKHGIYEL